VRPPGTEGQRSERRRAKWSPLYGPRGGRHAVLKYLYHGEKTAAFAKVPGSSPTCRSFGPPRHLSEVRPEPDTEDQSAMPLWRPSSLPRAVHR
jgi:hypothetical protein